MIVSTPLPTGQKRHPSEPRGQRQPVRIAISIVLLRSVHVSHGLAVHRVTPWTMHRERQRVTLVSFDHC